MKMAVKRVAIVLIGVFLQISISFALYMYLTEHIAFIHLLVSIASFLLSLALIKNSKNYSYTLPVIIILVLYPIVRIYTLFYT